MAGPPTPFIYAAAPGGSLFGEPRMDYADLRRPTTPGRALLAAVALLFGPASCGSDDGGKAAPELRNVFVEAPGGVEVDLLTPPDGGAGAVPATSALKLVFSQLLDGDKVELVLDGGGVMGMSGVATVTWTDAPAGAPPISAVTTYNPSGAMGVTQPAPSILVNLDPGLPSGAKLKLALARDKITSKKGTPFTGPDTHLFETAPFAVEAGLMDGETVVPDYAIVLTFSNVPDMNVASAITVAQGGGTAIAVDVKKDDMNPLVMRVTPRAGEWPVGGGYTVTVGAAAADLFGVKVAVPLSVGFSVAMAGADGGSPGADGGADASSDGGADGGADAVTDAPGAGGS
jgi:hypothetical protein